MKKYWEKGISFEEYFKKTEEIVNKDEEKLCWNIINWECRE